jgi:FkbM family methyltransferase
MNQRAQELHLGIHKEALRVRQAEAGRGHARAPSSNVSTIIGRLEPRHLRKLPYYARSAAVLARELRGESLLRALLRLPGPLELRNGLMLEVPELLDLLVLAEIVCDDVYRLRDLGQDASLIVDVGSGIGDFALLAALRFPGATVIACEPNPETYGVLVRNVERNGARNVDARSIAVGTRASYVLRKGAWSAEASAAGSSGMIATVAARRLDELIGPLEADLVKVDCEGGELDVLESLGTQVDHVRRFAIEYHDHLLVDAAARVVRLLRDRGFQASRLPDRYDSRIGYVYAQRKG